MTAEPHSAPAFPIVVTAASARDAALVLVDRPLAAPTRFTMKPSLLERTRTNVSVLFQPATLVHVNGTRWHVDTPPRGPKGALTLTVKQACDFLGIEPSRVSIIERLLDAHPELEPRLLPIARATVRTDRVRAAQPLLAALIVAHAASVAHVTRYG